MVVKFRRQSGAHSNRRRHASAITNLYPHRVMPGSQMNVRSQFTSSSSFNRMTIEIGSLNRGTFTVQVSGLCEPRQQLLILSPISLSAGRLLHCLVDKSLGLRTARRRG